MAGDEARPDEERARVRKVALDDLVAEALGTERPSRAAAERAPRGLARGEGGGGLGSGGPVSLRVALSPAVAFLLLLAILAVWSLVGLVVYALFVDREPLGTRAVVVERPVAPPQATYFMEVVGDGSVVFLIAGDKVYRSTRFGESGSWELVLSLGE
ncbi:hypothetical protein [Marinithermus hydrothermalis]|uniref:Uncharacterized protein n=1 Tax=Marinithermus hydrothermalis (strain DSM 14884 / JCM 11576 / T1) TaxID=869210 RepID=F2NNK5_MARHT|nr:hypothetical protein [Marinithermus hydrothermalis]AEB11020.1 hypothetical protein Marky_0259 [Marinithermus hydrothermalis DSM 14884]